MIDYNTGGSYVREGKTTLKELMAMWNEDKIKFASIKERYHIY